MATFRVAVIMDNAFTVFEEEPMLGISRYGRESGIEVVFFGVGAVNPENPEDMARFRFLEMISKEEFDGVILVSASLMNYDGGEHLRDKMKNLIPLPFISIGPSVLDEDSYLCENESGIAKIMDHLIRCHGYRKFAYVSGPFSNAEALARLDAYRKALDAAGIPHSEKEEFEGYFITPSGYAAVGEFLDNRGLEPEVIVCANDFMALGVWNALRDRGLSVPHDIAVTGFDDIQLSRALSHQFTTVHQSFEEMGYLAMERIHALMENRTVPPLSMIETSLRIRSSCGCVNIDGRETTDIIGSGVDLLRGMKSDIVETINSDMTGSGLEDLYRKWVDFIHIALKDNRSVYELETFLRGIRADIKDDENGIRLKLLIQVLHSLLLEECGQSVFADYWRDYFVSLGLRVRIDTLQDKLNSDLNLEMHQEDFYEIADFCNSEQFHFFRFRNSRDISEGADVLFSRPERFRVLQPESGKWFPKRGSGSLVANMIVFNGDLFGYMLFESTNVVLSSYDYVRIRYSGICKDLIGLTNIRSLNRDLLAEISERELAQKKLKEALQMVEKLSVEDELTHLYNRRGFITFADQQIKYLRRQNIPFMILYGDLDGLKTINDQFGHNCGDLAIKTMAEILKQSLRDSDIICRMGGDEFTVLVNKTDENSFALINQRIQRLARKKNRELEVSWVLSISLGHFYSEPDCSLSLDEMLTLADEDLYRNKKRKSGKA